MQTTPQMNTRMTKTQKNRKHTPTITRAGMMLAIISGTLSYIPSFGAVDIADYHPDVDEWTFMGMPITVTHWMPLPEPPEEER